VKVVNPGCQMNQILTDPIKENNNYST